jgi:hypothetical protein
MRDLDFISARRLILAAVVSLSSLAMGALLAAPAALAEEPCPNIASRQGPSAALPDCRAYEQVTPANKADATDVFPSSPVTELRGFNNEGGYVAEDGEHVLFYSEASFAGGDSRQSSYVFSRGAAGWTMTSLSPGAGIFGVQPTVFDTENLSEVGLQIFGIARHPGQPEVITYTSSVTPPGGPSTIIGEGEETPVVGASASLSHVVLESTDHEDVPGPPGLYEGVPALDEWFDGQLKPIDVATNGSLLSPCGAMLGSGEENSQPHNAEHNAMSSDGSRVVFTDPSTVTAVPREREGLPVAGCWRKKEEAGGSNQTEENPPEVYMRIDGTSTVEISVPNRGVTPEAPQAAVFVGASSDDSKVFFVTRAELTADDTTHAPELYEYNLEAPEGERLVRVSSGESGTAEGDVGFVPAISSDGSTVYFTAWAKLAEGATNDTLNANVPNDTPGGDILNLYHYDTATRKTTYVSQVPSAYPVEQNVPNSYNISFGWGANLFGDNAFYSSYGEGEIQANNDVALRPKANWATTNDGQYLLFSSTLPLTGYDNLGTYQGVNSSGEEVFEKNFPFEELFRYDAANGSLVCVSCVAGAPEPIDNATFNRGVLGMDLVDAGPPHAISEDGSYAFFETESALVPQAVPGRLHVYEWHDGTVSLISSADDPSGAFFLGASADGSNVLFGTHAQLVAQDTDQGGDIYDARIDGGFVGITPSQCTGTGCQGIPGAPPIFATPASVTFGGVGNFEPSTAVVKPKPKPKPAKCKKGFVRKKGKCVKAKVKKKAKKSNRRGK